MTSIDSLTERMRAFTAERDWQQFHSPKNLAMALNVECGELMEHFQWLSEEQSRSLDEQTKQRVSEEVADVLLYLLRLTDQLEIDLLESADKKIAINEKKYPADVVRGSARKYSDY